MNRWETLRNWAASIVDNSLPVAADDGGRGACGSGCGVANGWGKGGGDGELQGWAGEQLGNFHFQSFLRETVERGSSRPGLEHAIPDKVRDERSVNWRALYTA